MPHGALTAAAVAALLCACGEPAPEPPANTTWVMPEIRVVDLDGFQAALNERKGQPLLLNFWAIWCAPCVAELPDLIAAGRDLRAKGGEVIGVAMDMNARGAVIEEVEAQMPGFLARHRVDYPILIFNDPDPFALTRLLDLEGPIPETLAIDAGGRVVASHLGRASRHELAELARHALGH